MTSWGRPVFTKRWQDTETGERAGSRPLTSAGRRVGATAIGLAVLVPAVLPGINTSGVLGLGDKGTGSSSTITTADPLVDLKRRLVELRDGDVLTYKTTAKQPDYLRRYTLDKFDGNHWTYSPLTAQNSTRLQNGEVPQPVGLVSVPTVPVTTEIEVSKQVKDMDFLPVPYAPAKVDIDGDWQADEPSLMIYSTRSKAGGKRFTVESLQAQPTREQLDGAGNADVGGYTDVPNVPTPVYDLTARILKGKNTDYERAMAIQGYFLKNFTYSLEPPPPTQVSNLMAFLRDKRGYCEQFAATMALMARVARIPARVAVGFAPGTRQDDGRWVVKQKDSHAWPELYFAGAGWVRFEPTPPGAGLPSAVGAPSYAIPQPRTGPSNGPSASSAPVPTDGRSSSASPTTDPNDPRNRFDQETGLPLTEEKDNPVPVGWILGVLGLLLLLAIPYLLREAVRRYRWSRATDPASAARAAWSQLRADTLDHGLPWSSSETPRTVHRKLAEDVPAASVPLARIAHAQELARYARPDHPIPADSRSLHADNRAVRTALSASSGRVTRLRARVAPPSSLDALRRATEKTFDAVEGFRRK